MTASVQGFCDERFMQGSKRCLRHCFREGADLGASFSATWQGETVVDLWGGYLDENKTRPWQEDTIVNVYSTTKTMSFLCALLLADRGELDFDAPVARYWPEFAAAGKGDVLVWHLMNHAAGLSGMDERLQGDELYDWERVTQLLAQQAPWWTPGSASGYHALTQGYLIGEVVRRITGQSLGQFFAEQIAGPLNADFFIGVPDSEFHRIGNLIPPPDGAVLGQGAVTDSIPYKTFASPRTSALDSHTDGWRRAEIPGGEWSWQCQGRCKDSFSAGQWWPSWGCSALVARDLSIGHANANRRHGPRFRRADGLWSWLWLAPGQSRST